MKYSSRLWYTVDAINKKRYCKDIYCSAYPFFVYKAEDKALIFLRSEADWADNQQDENSDGSVLSKEESANESRGFSRIGLSKDENVCRIEYGAEG